MLIIFDVDGTLIGGEEYDWKSFNDAFTEITGKTFSIEFWKTLDEVTASAIVHEGLSDLEHTERARLELLVKDCCLKNLKLERERTPGAFFSTNETRALLEHLREHDEYDIAIATGDWYDTIRYKLEVAGIELERFIHATSSDAPIRSEIIAIAAERSDRSLEDVVYVGDGTWDIRACRALGIPFIGTGSRIDSLVREGARWTLRSLHQEPFFEILSEIQKEAGKP